MVGRRALGAPIRKVGCPHRVESFEGTLTARRVHIARGLALQAEVLLIDEPFAGLDAPTRGELLHQSSHVIRDATRATLVVVHDAAEAWALADGLVVLLDGKVAAAGAVADVMERPPTLESARFLGFTGTLASATGRVVAIRPADVELAPDGEHSGTVVATTPTGDGLLCTIELGPGTVQARADLPGPAIGAQVRVSIHGGVEYPEPSS